MGAVAVELLTGERPGSDGKLPAVEGPLGEFIRGVRRAIRPTGLNPRTKPAACWPPAVCSRPRAARPGPTIPMLRKSSTNSRPSHHRGLQQDRRHSHRPRGSRHRNIRKPWLGSPTPLCPRGRPASGSRRAPKPYELPLTVWGRRRRSGTASRLHPMAGIRLRPQARSSVSLAMGGRRRPSAASRSRPMVGIRLRPKDRGSVVLATGGRGRSGAAGRLRPRGRGGKRCGLHLMAWSRLRSGAAGWVRPGVAGRLRVGGAAGWLRRGVGSGSWLVGGSSVLRARFARTGQGVGCWGFAAGVGGDGCCEFCRGRLGCLGRLGGSCSDDAGRSCDDSGESGSGQAAGWGACDYHHGCGRWVTRM